MHGVSARDDAERGGQEDRGEGVEEDLDEHAREGPGQR